ncbi:MAG: diguanylate cyclase [Alkalispirochaeta sp.]
MSNVGADQHHLDFLSRRAWEQSFRDPEAAEQFASEALALAQGLTNLESEISARLSRAWARTVQADYQGAQDDLDEALRLCRDGNVDPDLLAKIHNAYGAVHFGRSELARAIASYQESLTVAERHRMPSAQIAAHNNLGEVELGLGHVNSARGLFVQAQRLLQKHPDAGTEAVVLSNLGEVALRENDLPTARSRFLLAREGAREVQDRFTEGEIVSRLGILAAREGRHEEAERYHTESIEIARELKSPVMRVSALMNLGDFHRQLGQPAMAEQMFRHARELAQHINARHFTYRLHQRLAEIAEEQGDVTTALTEYKRYMELKSELQEDWTEHRLEDLTRTIEAERLRAVSEIAQEITSSLDLEEILDQIYAHVNRVLDAQVFSIGVYDEEEHSLESRLVIENGRRLEPYQVSLEEGKTFSGWVVRHRKPIMIEDLNVQYRDYLNAYPEHADADGNYSALYLPLLVKDRLVGVLSIQTHRAHAYSELDIRIVRTLAAFLAIAIDNALIIDRVTVLNRLVVQEKDELRHAYDHISELANRDHLTGVSNRRMFHQFVAACLDRRRENPEPLGIVFIDLDHFKPINDTYGHQAGDTVLQEVANRLQSATRSDDLVARVGGDEFVVVLTVGPSAAAVEAIAAKLKQAVSAPIDITSDAGTSTSSVTVSASTGYALFPDHGATYDELVRHADSQMYGAKRTRG